MQPGGADSLLANLTTDVGLNHAWARMALRLETGDMAGAAAMQGQLRDKNGFAHLQQVIAMGTIHGGNWSLLDSTEVDSLVDYALSGQQGAAVYEGILRAHNLADVETEAIFPDKFRSMQDNEDAVVLEAAYAISAYPNPAEETTWLTYPAELAGSAFRVEDAQGRMVQQARFSGGGLMELHCAALANGMYAIVSSDNKAKGRLLVKH